MADQSLIKEGDYAISAHTVLISGDVIDVFVGKWETGTSSSRVLRKYPRETIVPDGELMCVLKLRRPMTLEEYRESHHPDLRPMVKDINSKVELVLMPMTMICTIPDGM